jgi:hypothetical protein
MNKAAFLRGYLQKEAIAGAIGRAVAPIAIPLAPAMTVDMVGEKWQDQDIAEYRRKLGLPPEEPNPEDISQKKLQDAATQGSVSITT